MKHFDSEDDIDGDPFESVRTKSPDEFTGKGAEIIGNPDNTSKEGGTILYLDGRYQGISSAEPTSDKPLSTEDPRLEVAKRALGLSLSRTNKGVIDEQNSSDRNDFITAHQLGEEFAKAILAGTLPELARAVVKQKNTIKDKTKTRELQTNKSIGYSVALIAVSSLASHPKEITIQAVKDFIDSNRDGFKRYEFIAAEITIRDIENYLTKRGFGWLKRGTRRSGKR